MKQKCKVCNQLRKISFNGVFVDQCINCNIIKIHINSYEKVINNIINQNSVYLALPINTILSKFEKYMLLKLKNMFSFDNSSALVTIKQINDQLSIIKYFNTFYFYFNTKSDMLYFYKQDFEKLKKIIFKKYKRQYFFIKLLFLLKLDWILK